MKSLFDFEGVCSCGKAHTSTVKNVLVGAGTISLLPEEMAKLNIKKAFILADENTYNVAGETVTRGLKSKNISYAKYVFGV